MIFKTLKMILLSMKSTKKYTWNFTSKTLKIKKNKLNQNLNFTMKSKMLKINYHIC
jgi:hypothetical protein